MIEIVAEALIVEAIERMGGTAGYWVSVTELRKAVGMTTEDFDAAAQRLAAKMTVVFVPEDVQKSLTDLDRACAIRIGGQDCHLATMG